MMMMMMNDGANQGREPEPEGGRMMGHLAPRDSHSTALDADGSHEKAKDVETGSDATNEEAIECGLASQILFAESQMTVQKRTGEDGASDMHDSNFYTNPKKALQCTFCPLSFPSNSQLVSTCLL